MKGTHSTANGITTKHAANIEFDGIGTHWWVELLGTDEFPDKLVEFITGTTSLFEDMYSRFHDETLIGQLNIHKHLAKPPQELLDMFEFAYKMHGATDGAFNISVGGTLQRLGYGDTKTAESAAANFWEQTKFNRNEIVIPRESAVDLGGFGKGWLLDKLAVLLEKHGHSYYLINGGGDIVLSNHEPIELGLEHPYEPDKIIGSTKLSRGAVAVSSVTKRRWKKNGSLHHHIIEPRSDKAADSTVVSTYVRGKTALIADTLATVLLLRPELKARLEKQFDIETILITADQLA